MRKVAFLLAGSNISGGVAVILEHARGLADAGIDVSLITRTEHHPDEFFWHPAYSHIKTDIVHLKSFAHAQAEHFDAAIATYWRTVFDLYRVSADKYLYFVQSIESRFAREDELSLRFVIDATYEQGLGIVTIAGWMVDWLRRSHGVQASLARNGINKQIFTVAGPIIPRTRPHCLRVLVEGAVDVGFKNVPNTLSACAAAGVGDIWLLTNSHVEEFPGTRRVFSQVSMEQAAKIYRSTDVLVKLSLVEGMFGPPLEMFSCGGTSVVFDVTGHDEYIRHGENGLVVPTGHYGEISRWLKLLAANPKLLAELRAGARDTANRWPAWNESSTRFHQALREAADTAHVSRADLRRRTERLWALYRSSQSLPVAGLSNLSERELALGRELNEMRNSTSWAVTAPLRKIGIWLPKLKFACSLLLRQRRRRHA